MFKDMMDMMGNHEDRKVGTYNEDGIFVDTCFVTDADQPYETAVVHPNYNGGSMVIVEMYRSLNAAERGHAKWVAVMTGKDLPAHLKDVGTSGISQLLDSVAGDKDWRKVKVKD